ncbi:MAG: amidohydrolase [Candidatus Bathyarchaeota archaeon]|nr:amidohydrolase [Candidatus Bathyarchaeota archaeon]
MLALVNGKILTITDGVIKKGTVLVEDGKIKALGADVEVPSGAKVINCRGKWVMPGLVDAHVHIGIWEESVGWAGNDGNEATDPITPHVRALDGIKANADEGGLKAALENGVTTVQILPGSANVIGGTGVIVKTVPKTSVDEMVLVEPSGMKVAFGENPKRVYGVDKKVLPSTRMGVAGIMREWLYKTKTYMEKKDRFKDEPDKLPEKDLRLEALEPVLRGVLPMRVHAHRADDAITAIRICEEFGIKMSWEHATEGHRIADLVAAKGIPAVWGPGLNWRSKWETRERTFETLKTMYDAGVKIAIQTDADNGKIGFLPISAALAVRDGLPEEEALKAITINPAEILGIADRVGSLEVGKDADIRVTNGDPLDPRSRVELVLVDGEIVFSR